MSDTSSFDLNRYISPDIWTTPNSQHYSAGQLFMPLSSTVDTWDVHFHELLLRDRLRMEKFCEAVKVAANNIAAQHAHSKHVVRILDIGAGSGIWAYLFWAQLVDVLPPDRLKIYGLEANPITFENILEPSIARSVSACGRQHAARKSLMMLNTFSGSFRNFILYGDNRDDVKNFDSELFKKFRGGTTAIFDAVICECIGGLGDNEGIVEILNHARRELIAPGGLIIPETVNLFVVPIDSRIDDANLHRMLDAYLKIRKGDYSELHGDKERIPSIQPEGPSMFDVAIPNAWHSEWTPQLVITHDFRSGGAAAEKYVTQPVVFDPKNGTCPRSIIGFKAFFRCVLFSSEGGQIILDTSNEEKGGRISDCWKHTFLPLANTLELSVDDHLWFSLWRDPCQTSPMSNGGMRGIDRSVPPAVYGWAAAKTETTLRGLDGTAFGGKTMVFHKLLSDKSGQYLTNSLRFYDWYRSLGLFADMILVLCGGVLFDMAVGAERVPNFLDRMMVGCLILQLLRVFHSFTILRGDSHFADIEYLEFLEIAQDSNRLRSVSNQLYRIFGRVLLSVLTFVLIIILSYHPTWCYTSGVWHFGHQGHPSCGGFQISESFWIVSFSFIIVASLYAFDRSAQKPVGAMLSAARGTAEEAWLNTVKKAVGLWILLDRIYLGFTILLTVSLGLVSYGTLDHFRLSMKEPLTIPEILNFILWGAQILSIGLFVVSFSLDYGRNVSFYSGRRANVNHENEGGHRI